jgi:ParB family chromosome partitioning protein
VQLVNDRGDEPPGKIPPETVEALAELLAHGGPAARARTAHLLRYLAEKEPAAWEQAWRIHAERFGGPPHPQPLSPEAGARGGRGEYTPEQLRELAFGAYIGLVREQGGHAAESQFVRVRQTALARLQELAVSGGRQAAVRPVLVQALADPNQAVRLQAFDQLAALGVDADTLGAAALGAGHTDVGVRGLEALAGGGTSAEGQAVLEEALRNRTDALAVEAAKLLAGRRGTVAAAGLALGAAYEPLRRQAVAWLGAEDERDPAARGLLRQALQSRHAEVVEEAALALAVKKDAAAFDALVRLLHAAREPGPQGQFIKALEGLGDPRAADAFLDRIENDPDATALFAILFQAAAGFRRPETADRMLGMSTTAKWRQLALTAVHFVSGFIQPIEDPEDENPDRRWEEKQFPRHDAVLARLLRRTADLKDKALLLRFLPRAHWSRGHDVDPVLATLTVHADDAVRRQALEAVGWRLRKRQGPAEPLVKGLKHRDPVTQLVAAEGLALAGREEGMSTLLAAVDLQSDLELRQRAVKALGELGDPRALDLLLKIVNDPEHVLRGTAAEALGHMGRSAKAEEILQLLTDLARGDAAEGALRGLRWFDHPEGWHLIRRRAAESAFAQQETAVELLGFNDDPATRDLLLRLLAQSDDQGVCQAALASARRLWGPDSPEPDYAVVQNPEFLSDEDECETLFRRLRERGDARRLLELLPKLDAETAERVKGLLLNRQPLPVAEAQAVVAGPDAVAAGVAAHLLGRAGPAAPSAGPAVAAALRRWWGEWDNGRQDEARRGAAPGARTRLLLDPLCSLVWAAGRLRVAADTLLTVATTRADVPFDRPLRRAAVAALADGDPTGPALEALERLAAGDDPEVRATAAAAVARADAGRAAALAGRLLSDRVAFNRAAVRGGAELEGVLRGAAVQVHYQGVAVPHLAARNDVAGLAAVARNRGFPEETRLGAVEGLAAAASTEAEAELVRLGQAEEEPEELRKAAWRGLRRSRRARQRAAQEPSS